MGTTYAEKKDMVERTYHTAYSNLETNAVVCAEGTNTVFKGTPKFNLRTGTSEFGEEMFFEFLIGKKVEEYPSNSKYATIEVYFGVNDGIQFLEDALKHLKEHQTKGE